nr:MAG TPA: hypothetical protein [Caudoviricetes sp.]
MGIRSFPEYGTLQNYRETILENKESLVLSLFFFIYILYQ